MTKKYPHLDDSTFPNIENVDVYKYKNTFDYSKYDSAQMRVTICNVPWDVGIVHVGQAQITGIGNVVKFKDDAARDAWFDSLNIVDSPELADNEDVDGFTWVTKFKRFHAEGEIKVELPFDTCARFNYVYIEHVPYANESDFVNYETANGLRKWFYFIREFKAEAPNTTNITILRDTWQTYINRVNIPYMVLERGHAPFTKINTDKYLNNPVNNNEWLLTPDVNFGEAALVAHTDSFVFNDEDMYAVIVTSGYPLGDWNLKTPAGYAYYKNGIESMFAFAMPTNSLDNFLQNIDTSIPQFKQTIKCIFFASEKLLTIGEAFTFANITCYKVESSGKIFDFTKLSKEQFGYDEKYSNLAKLYTSPYAHLEYYDEKGNVTVIRIEDTDGTIELRTSLSLAYPWLNIEAHLLGVGGNTREQLTFKNIDTRTCVINGRWYDTLKIWNIPTFAIILSADKEYNYSTHFQRIQQALQNSTAQTNANESANTAKTNADASADLSKRVADLNADTLKDNSDLNIATNSTILSNSQYGNTLDAGIATNLTTQLNYWDNQLTAALANAQADATLQSASISAAGSVIGNSVNGAVSGGLSGGPAGAATGLAQGLISGTVGALVTNAQSSVAANLTMTQAGLHTTNNTAHATQSNIATNDRTQNQNSVNEDNTDAQNDYIEATTDNTVQTQKDNAQDVNTTEKANNARTNATALSIAVRTKSTADDAITANVNQAALRAPFEYGSFANGETVSTLPQAAFLSIVTESKGQIAAAGDEFLRYGYSCNRNWQFEDFNLMKHFTYWKCSDIWVSGLDVPDAYMDDIRYFLLGGVTVWRNPDEIGKISIYENA